MAKIVCDLDCSNLVETFVPHVIEKLNRRITHAIYDARHKVRGDDVLVLHIVKMQMVFLHQVWSELLCMQKCDVEIKLDNLTSESELLFILSHALKQTNVTIKDIQIANINSQFFATSKKLIENYCQALSNANIPTNVVEKITLDPAAEEEKQLPLMLSPSGSPLAAVGHFAKPVATPVSTAVPSIPRVAV